MLATRGFLSNFKKAEIACGEPLVLNMDGRLTGQVVRHHKDGSRSSVQFSGLFYLYQAVYSIAGIGGHDALPMMRYDADSTPVSG